MISMTELRVLIVAAGKGSRSGLSFPKTLFPVQGKLILVRIHELLSHLDSSPTVIVSQSGQIEVAACLAKYDLAAHLVVQPEHRGMGDAVLCFQESPAFKVAEDLLLIWGDIPFIQPETVAALVKAHQQNCNDFTLITRQVDSAYTVVTRDVQGRLLGVTETREACTEGPQTGERDIGLFIFRKAPVFEMLQQDLPGKFGRTSEEHGFLYVIQQLVVRGYRVEGLPVATKMDLVSLNAMSDIKDYV
jgi:bifunctional N-acetylglucosamine-1-phosphate-uridyltransferase/glucosamine-1-phosphate-acetyltransferase GlmU-like protein